MILLQCWLCQMLIVEKKTLSLIVEWVFLICIKTLIPFTQECFGSVVLEKKIKCEKSTTTTTSTTTTDNAQTLIRKVYLSLRLSWAKNKSANCTLHLIFAKQNIVPFKTCFSSFSKNKFEVTVVGNCLVTLTNTFYQQLDNWNNIWLSRIIKLTQSPWISLHIVFGIKKIYFVKRHSFKV